MTSGAKKGKHWSKYVKDFRGQQSSKIAESADAALRKDLRPSETKYALERHQKHNDLHHQD